MASTATMMMLWTLPRPVAATTSSAHVTLTCPLGLTFFGKHLHRLRNTLSEAHSTQFIHRCVPSRLTVALSLRLTLIRCVRVHRPAQPEQEHVASRVGYGWSRDQL